MTTETFRLSSRQISLLNDFGNQRSISLRDCLLIDQRTFGSLIRNELIDFNESSTSFQITAKGRAVFRAYLHTETHRQNTLKFSPSVNVLIQKAGAKPKVISMTLRAAG